MVELWDELKKFGTEVRGMIFQGITGLLALFIMMCIIALCWWVLWLLVEWVFVLSWHLTYAQVLVTVMVFEFTKFYISE